MSTRRDPTLAVSLLFSAVALGVLGAQRLRPGGDTRVGERVRLRYFPGAPHLGAYVGDDPPWPPPALAGVAALVLLSLPMVVLWTIRLCGWLLAALMRPAPATLRVHTSVYRGFTLRRAVSSEGPLWIESAGRYQRVMWHKGLVAACRAGQLEATVRRRPGPRAPAMFEVPGVGRLLPAGRLRDRVSRRWELEPLRQRPPLTTDAAPSRIRRLVGVLVAVVLLAPVTLGVLTGGNALLIVFGSIFLHIALLILWMGTPVLAVFQGDRGTSE